MGRDHREHLLAGRELRDLFRSMLERSPHGAFLVDRAGSYLYVNDAACQITGYPRERLLGMNLRELLPDADADAARGEAHFQALMQAGEAKGELPFRHADGTERWWRIEATRIDDDLFAGFATDITETHRLHVDLDRERQRLARAQEIAGVGWWEADLARDTVNASDRTLEIYGVPPGVQLQFSDAQRQVLPEDRPRLDAALADLVAGRQPYDLEFGIHRLADRALRRIRSVARYDADRRTVFGVLLDITEVSENIAALSRREAPFRAIFDSVSEFIFLKDLDLRYTHINRAALEFLGLDADQVIGMTDADLFPAEQVREIMETDRQVLAGGDQPQRFIRLLGPRRRLLETAKIAVRDDAGDVVGLCGVSRDVTDLRRLEEQLRQSQKLEAIGRLAGGIAHDLNNLLTPILGYSELLKASLADDPAVSRELAAIERSGLRARDLTANLLAFSRRQVLDRRIVCLNDIVAETRDMLRRLLRENIQIRYDLAADLDSVRADSSQLHNVLINLAVNAADAMPDGGLLTIETQNVELDEAHADRHPEALPGPHVLLAVADTGCGMAPDVQRQVFEPFFTTKAVDEGTGLGLATVHGVVKQHGGSIDLYSEPDHGTIFKVYLPRVTGDPAGPDDAGAAADGAGDEEILVVEDDEAVRQLAEAVLVRQGYRVVAVASPSAAITLATERDRPFDLVLSDVVMPGMDGAQLHRTLKNVWPRLPALFMSGYTANVIEHHGVLPEGLRFIQKPFRPQDLVRRVREILDDGAAGV